VKSKVPITVDRARLHLPFWRRDSLNQMWKGRNGIIFTLPAVVLILVFLGYPLFRSFNLSLLRWSGVGEPTYIGLDNFERLWDDPEFFIVLKNSFLFTLVTAFGEVILGFFLAVAIERRVRGWGIYKIVFFLPAIIPRAITGSIWTRLLDPLIGPINPILRGLGYDPPLWLSDSGWALYGVAFVAIWQYSGFPMLVMLAAMENIPLEVHEAATLDGVNGWQRMRSIIFPLILPTIAVLLMLQLIAGLKAFDLIWVMTRGGPGNATKLLGVSLYEKAFEAQTLGYASAWAVVMAAIIMTVSLLYQRYLRPEGVEF
jgi:ABC-type sugar transport system permease subunit